MRMMMEMVERSATSSIDRSPCHLFSFIYSIANCSCQPGSRVSNVHITERQRPWRRPPCHPLRWTVGREVGFLIFSQSAFLAARCRCTKDQRGQCRPPNTTTPSHACFVPVRVYRHHALQRIVQIQAGQAGSRHSSRQGSTRPRQQERPTGLFVQRQRRSWAGPTCGNRHPVPVFTT